VNFYDWNSSDQGSPWKMSTDFGLLHETPEIFYVVDV
jgi:hypothetical protein